MTTNAVDLRWRKWDHWQGPTLEILLHGDKRSWLASAALPPSGEIPLPLFLDCLQQLIDRARAELPALERAENNLVPTP